MAAQLVATLKAPRDHKRGRRVADRSTLHLAGAADVTAKMIQLLSEKFDSCCRHATSTRKTLVSLVHISKQHSTRSFSTEKRQFEKLIVDQLIEKHHFFYGTRWIVAMLTRSLH